MAIRFEAKYAVPVMIAVVHDLLITAGVYSLVGAEVSSATVAAFLTILGYSLYDTVIVFDRIRENVPRLPRAAFSQIVNRSMSEVLTRSLITGLSTVFLIAVLLVFGGETLRAFAFAMLVGVASGTYSSIFIASPVLTAWKEREPQYRSRRRVLEEAMGRVPPFPEENVVARLDEEAEREEGGEAEAERRRQPEPAAPAPARRSGGAGRRRRRRTMERARRRGRRRRPAEPEPGERAWSAPAGPPRRSAPSSERRAAAEGAPPAAPPQEAREAPMSALVWFTVGVALWHFTVFVADRFWGGIVGAFLGSIAGAMVTGAVVQMATGQSIGDTDIGTVLAAIPGALIGMAAIYALGARREATV